VRSILDHRQRGHRAACDGHAKANCHQLPVLQEIVEKLLSVPHSAFPAIRKRIIESSVLALQMFGCREAVPRKQPLASLQDLTRAGVLLSHRRTGNHPMSRVNSDEVVTLPIDGKYRREVNDSRR
jgi:hypothetical protein